MGSFVHSFTEVTCLFLSVTESDPQRSWRGGVNKAGSLEFSGHERGRSGICQHRHQLDIRIFARYAVGSQLKRGALYT
ncbi:hypothetical protein D3C87_1800920 [compost metagenome]